MTRCRDCKLYDLESVKNVRGAVMSNWPARCLWVFKGTPASIDRGQLPLKTKMFPNEGAGCQTFVPRKDAK